MSTVTYGPAEGRPHTHTIIMLHGRDSDASEFAPEFFESEATGPEGEDRTLLGLFPTIRWVFPSAPTIRSERFDTEMSQWFDMWSVEDPEQRVELQKESLQGSIQKVIDVVRAEEALVPRERMFLAGISQGFATALATFFADGQGFAGLLGLCSWLPLATAVDEIKHTRVENNKNKGARNNDSRAHNVNNRAHSENNRAQDAIDATSATDTTYATSATDATDAKNATDAASATNATFAALQQLYTGTHQTGAPTSLEKVPVMLGHAVDDEVVPIANGRRLKDTMESLGFEVEWHEYTDGGHWVNEPAGVDDIVRFIRLRMVEGRLREQDGKSVGRAR
ncbi:Alpha/Beta hydrolase protein [Xylariomycetidae sp. FL2044]|nr:Alpha/Beta hydrolase protein [Xylariomycetidae sp. FL2044]